MRGAILEMAVHFVLLAWILVIWFKVSRIEKHMENLENEIRKDNK